METFVGTWKHYCTGVLEQKQRKNWNPKCVQSVLELLETLALHFNNFIIACSIVEWI